MFSITSFATGTRTENTFSQSAASLLIFSFLLCCYVVLIHSFAQFSLESLHFDDF